MWECMLQARTGWQSVEKCGQQCGGTHRPGARDRGAPADGMYEGQEYLTATVRDFGKGFSEQDLTMQIRNFTAGMPADMTGRIRGSVLRSQKNS